MKTNKVRLIDANALKTSFEEDGHMSSYIEEFIDNAPTIDAVPVVHGEFKKQQEEVILNLRVTPLLCKTCLTTFITLNKEGKRCMCCSYCGARMDGEPE